MMAARIPRTRGSLRLLMAATPWAALGAGLAGLFLLLPRIRDLHAPWIPLLILFFLMLITVGAVAVLLLRWRLAGAARPHGDPATAASSASAAAESTRLRMILDHLPASFLLMDSDQRVVLASANFEKVTGRRIEQMVGRHCTRNLWFDELCAGCPSELAVRSRKPECEVVRVPVEDGSVRHIEHLSVPILRDGGVEAILEIVSDVSNRRVLQDQMIRAEKLAAAGEMAAVIAHEMRNSMTSVKMILQLLLESQEEAAGRREPIQVALSSVRRSEAVVNELLQFARPARLRREPCWVPCLIEESVAFVEHQLRLQDTSLEICVASDLPTLTADPQQLKTAMVNLLLNASQAVQCGGRIVVRGARRRLAAPLLDVCAVEPAGQGEDREGGEGFGRGASGPIPAYRQVVLPRGLEVVALEVEDTGCGIPEEGLARIFDPFFTTKVNGTGLGLPLVKRITNAHGGVVTVSSSSSGSRFSLVLPVEPSLVPAP